MADDKTTRTEVGNLVDQAQQSPEVLRRQMGSRVNSILKGAIDTRYVRYAATPQARVHGPYSFAWSHAANSGGFYTITTTEALGANWVVLGHVTHPASGPGAGWTTWTVRGIGTTSFEIALVNQAPAAATGSFYCSVLSFG